MDVDDGGDDLDNMGEVCPVTIETLFQSISHNLIFVVIFDLITKAIDKTLTPVPGLVFGTFDASKTWSLKMWKADKYEAWGQVQPLSASSGFSGAEVFHRSQPGKQENTILNLWQGC